MKIRIKTLCEERKISQRELAASIGVTPMTINNVTRGKVSLDLLEKIATALGVSISALFEDTPLPFNGATCPYCGAKLDVEFEK